jgi:hypothetical protein
MISMVSIGPPPKPPSASANGTPSQPSSANVFQLSVLKTRLVLDEFLPRVERVIVLNETLDAVLQQALFVGEGKIHESSTPVTNVLVSASGLF